MSTTLTTESTQQTPEAKLPTRTYLQPDAEISALRSVDSPRATRKLALAFVVLALLLPPVLLFVPWQQNVAGGGRVTAFHPLDRPQIIPAPVKGRLIKLHVREGQRVQAGQELAEMADQDPNYSTRLTQQTAVARQKLNAARDMVEFYNQQLIYLEDAREEAISEAGFALEVAIEEIRAEEQAMSAAEAEYNQKRDDRERKWRLFSEGGVVSELDFQKAEAAALSAFAKVEEMRAKVEQARNKEKGKLASVGKISNDQRAKIESAKSSREDARSKAALAEKELIEASTKEARQLTRVVLAERDGTILRIHAAQSSDFIEQGAPLIELVPDTDDMAVELWMRGVDTPLIEQGRKVRLQFEGWPAVQFAGWPSVAVGTFGGKVSLVDSQATQGGKFRVLVSPDPEDAPWPNRNYLRQGVQTNGWVLLDEVSIGYEIWRQLNAFPPSIDRMPEDGGLSKKKQKSGGKK